MDTLLELFEEQLKDLYNAENQLVKALPKLAEKATCEGLKQGLKDHVKETKEHVARLEAIASQMEITPSGKKCKAMEGLIAEGDEVLEEDGDDSVIDVAIVAACQRVEHYEIAAYGTLVAIAEQLELADAVEILQQTLEEEKAADEKLTDVCQTEIFASASSDDDDSEDELEEEFDEDDEDEEEDDARSN